MLTGTSPLETCLDRRGFAALDGGTATLLEQRGFNLDHPLWSSLILKTNPQALVDVHRAYLEAGADCLITASYQATLPGLLQAGATRGEAETIIKRSVRVARQAIEECGPRVEGPTPRVAGSIGPYGAYLADGSEYRGDYAVSRRELEAFHRPRWEWLVEAGADVLACETLPQLLEAQVLLDMLKSSPSTTAWFSFSCRDSRHLHDGTALDRCVEMLAPVPQVAAIGINCTAPRFVEALVARIRRLAPHKRIVAYPNSGETYDAATGQWHGTSTASDFGKMAVRWRAAGASLIGGCCQTGPMHIRAIRQALNDSVDAGRQGEDG